jgi:benzoyl-CoA reductase/2-hydroxyglutaryl-CoA dehydratase subunit BcrC/BadD/HgdB
VGNLFPIRLRAPQVTSTEMADVYLSSVICSLTRSFLESALEGDYEFLRGFVFTASCDHLRRLNDNLEYCAKQEFTHVMDIPHRYGEAAVQWTVEEFRRFAQKLEDFFGIEMSNENILKAIAEREALNTILREISDMRRLASPPFSGTEYHRLIMASQVVPPDAAFSLAREFREAAAQNTDVHKHRARVMVVGGNLDDPSYTQIIESMGALVVVDRYCTGSFPALEPYETAGDPFEMLAKRILSKTKCPRMMEGFEERLSYIINLVKEYAVDGVIVESIKFCDTWGVETSAMVKRLRELNIPVLRLEREYRLGGEGQLRTRVQAFLESMGK